jgi:hypothetical protein
VCAWVSAPFLPLLMAVFATHTLAVKSLLGGGGEGLAPPYPLTPSFERPLNCGRSGQEGGCREETPRTSPAASRSEDKDDARLWDKRVAEGLSGGDPPHPPLRRRTKAMPVCGISGSQEVYRGETLLIPPPPPLALGRTCARPPARALGHPHMRSPAPSCSLVARSLARNCARPRTPLALTCKR